LGNLEIITKAVAVAAASLFGGQMLEGFNEFLWSVPVLGLILMAGIWLTVRTGFAQLRLFPAACREFWHRMKNRDSGFRALCTALAATVGTGNIAGVAGAIAIGGPGAVFWMWVSAFLGLMVKFAEGTLAVRYREPDGRAGPMYIISRGLGNHWRWLAGAYSFFGIIAAFGVGNATQINAVISSLESTGAGRGFVLTVGFVLAAVVALMVTGEARPR
jgi:AGCS family alanine or glycine:cation symporter